MEKQLIQKPKESSSERFTDDPFRLYVEKVTNEIERAGNSNLRVLVGCYADNQKTRSYQIVLHVYGFLEPIIIKKVAKDRIVALKKARKAALQKIYRERARRRDI